MVKSKLSPSTRYLLAAFVAVLFIRSFGLLGLFQNTPSEKGLGQDKQYAKKIHFVKKNMPTEVLPLSVDLAEMPVFSLFEPALHTFSAELQIPLSLLRSPPVLR